MKNTSNSIALVKDKATRDALQSLADEIDRIKRIAPVNEDVKSLAIAVNKITGKLK